MRKIALKIAYDGTAYSGWQRQLNAITVQQRLEEAISRLLGEDVSVQGAGRTDSGVHARAQFAAFETECSIPVERLQPALNAILPKDIRLMAAFDVPLDFHPRKSGHHKTYAYSIALTEPELFAARYCHYVQFPLDIDKMREAAAYFIGEHDFKNFSVTGSSVKTSVRSIEKIEFRTLPANNSLIPWQRTPELLVIEITAGGFLYKMVRLMTARLVQVGRGEAPPEIIAGLLQSDSCRQIPPLPPQGLLLQEISYDDYEKYLKK